MQCQHCKKRKATVYIKETVNHQQNEKYICDICASELNQGGIPFSFSVHNLLSNYFDQVDTNKKDGQASNQSKCLQCGQIYGEYKESGRLGCSQCYQAFRRMLIPLIKRIHGGSQHTGKVPVKLERMHRLRRHINTLQNKLKKAIEDEAYEEAAQLRDEIALLEKKVTGIKGESE
ncbi:UvrB/UvrC motif-containing protein [Tindallia californiensis]|uniref:Protein arginine kinase activator n=1 Tax=Tindallia californiensis TaxID=159292 RepID=A0A1H3RA98_9FIRM|nr:UvrB/UvrC motif-containing protein [Tindallia californiensis]SDZ22158.1 protein arginine kinase activator [Tindallia californiensis]